jgi:hypothetical protein
MAHLLGAKEPHSFVAYLLKTYDYADDTEADLFFFYPAQDLSSHPNPKLMLN